MGRWDGGERDLDATRGSKNREPKRDPLTQLETNQLNELSDIDAKDLSTYYKKLFSDGWVERSSDVDFRNNPKEMRKYLRKNKPIKSTTKRKKCKCSIK
jgi:hypothetical protein